MSPINLVSVTIITPLFNNVNQITIYKMVNTTVEREGVFYGLFNTS